MAAARKAKSRRPVVGPPAARKKNPVRRRIAVKKPAAAARKDAGGVALRLAGVRTEAVLKATGRAWDEWLRVLDRAGARRMPHEEIAALLARKFAVPGWWCQMVTVGYEQARGLRG